MTEETTPAEPPIVQYKEDDLVYVDPDNKTVVGLVEWTATGKPKPMPVKINLPPEEPESPANPTDGKDDKGKRRRAPMRQRYYPWGTYRSMKRVYKLEGKQIRTESQQTLDEVMEKALKEPFWD